MSEPVSSASASRSRPPPSSPVLSGQGSACRRRLFLAVGEGLACRHARCFRGLGRDARAIRFEARPLQADRHRGRARTGARERCTRVARLGVDPVDLVQPFARGRFDVIRAPRPRPSGSETRLRLVLRLTHAARVGRGRRRGHRLLVVVIGSLGGSMDLLRLGRLDPRTTGQLAALISQAACIAARSTRSFARGGGSRRCQAGQPSVALVFPRPREVDAPAEPVAATSTSAVASAATSRGSALTAVGDRRRDGLHRGLGAGRGTRAQRGQHRVDAARDRQRLCRHGPPRAPGTKGPFEAAAGSVSRKAGSATVPGRGGRTGVRPSDDDVPSIDSPRRSAGPPWAGSVRTGESVKASLASVAARRRGTASGCHRQPHRTSGRPCPDGFEECGTCGDAEDQAKARNTNSLPVTLSATPSDRTPHRARAVPPRKASVAANYRSASTWHACA